MRIYWKCFFSELCRIIMITNCHQCIRIVYVSRCYFLSKLFKKKKIIIGETGTHRPCAGGNSKETTRSSEETLLNVIYTGNVRSRKSGGPVKKVYIIRMILPEQHLTLLGCVTVVTVENTFDGRSAVSITFALGVALYITIMGTCRICSTATPTSRSSLAKQ